MGKAKKCWPHLISSSHACVTQYLTTVTLLDIHHLYSPSEYTSHTPCLHKGRFEFSHINLLNWNSVSNQRPRIFDCRWFYIGPRAITLTEHFVDFVFLEFSKVSRADCYLTHSPTGVMGPSSHTETGELLYILFYPCAALACTQV